MPPSGALSLMYSRFYTNTAPPGLKKALNIQSFWLSYGVIANHTYQTQGSMLFYLLKLTLMVGLGIAPTSVGTFVLHSRRRIILLRTETLLKRLYRMP